MLISGERLSQADSLSVAILAVVARLWRRYYRSVTTHCYLKSVLKEEEEEEKKSLKQSAINLSQPIGVVVCSLNVSQYINSLVVGIFVIVHLMLNCF